MNSIEILDIKLILKELREVYLKGLYQSLNEKNECDDVKDIYIVSGKIKCLEEFDSKLSIFISKKEANNAKR